MRTLGGYFCSRIRKIVYLQFRRAQLRRNSSFALSWCSGKTEAFNQVANIQVVCIKYV